MRTRAASLALTSAVAVVLSMFTAAPVGAADPVDPVTLSASTLSFAATAAGQQSAAQHITVTNTGGDTTLAPVALSGAGKDSFVQNNTCSVDPDPFAAGATCDVSVWFAPAAAGDVTASLDVTDNATGVTQSVALSGTGTAPTAGVSPSSLAFGSHHVATTSAAQSVTVTNTGVGPLTISNLTVTGGDSGEFALQSSGTCAPGGQLAEN